MDWSAIESLVFDGADGMYLMICKRTDRSEKLVGRFDLTVSHARAMLALVPAAERLSVDLALQDREGGVGDLDQPALEAVLHVAEIWTRQRLDELAGSAVRVKLRAIGGDVLKTFTVAASSPPTVEDSGSDEDGAPSLEETTRVDRMLTVGRRHTEGGVRDLVVLERSRQEVARAQQELERERRQDQRAEITDALSYERDRSDQLITYLRKLLDNRDRDMNDLRAAHKDEIAERDRRIRELEDRLERLHTLLVSKAAEARVADAEAGQGSVTVQEIGRSVRELGSLAFKAGVVYTLRDRLTPELMSVLDKALSSPELMELANNPMVGELLADPEIARMIADPAERKLLVDQIKSMVSMQQEEKAA